MSPQTEYTAASNAPDIPGTKPVLLIVDMDAYYINNRSLPEPLLNAIKDFTKAARGHFSIIHVWHSFSELAQCLPEMKRTLYESDCKVMPVKGHSPAKAKYLPVTQPQKGDWILGKPLHSAFDDTNLARCLPKNVDVFVAGIYGDCCVEKTINDGLCFGYNIYALEDLIINFSSAQRQSDINYGVNAYNSKVLSALLP